MSTPDSDAYRAYRRWVTEPISEMPVVSVVIPAYEEEWRILPTIAAIAVHMSARGEPWELLLADDGSTDATVPLVEALRFPNLRVLRAERNGGKGSAVRRGVRAAKGTLILFADADQSTPIEQFDRLRAHVDDGADVVVGSRAALGADVRSKSLLRRTLSAGLRVFVRFGFGVRVRDTQCGFKLFRAEVAHDLFRQQRIDGFSFDLEVLWLAARAGYRVDEVAVEWIDAPGSTVDPGRVALQFLRDMVGLRLRSGRRTTSAGPSGSSAGADTDAGPSDPGTQRTNEEAA